MANFKIPNSTIEGRDAVVTGMYKLRLDGFKPSMSKKADSINLNPVLKTNEFKDPNGEEIRIFFNMNTNFGPGLTDLCHGFGLQLIKNGDGYTIPGKFDGPDNDPTKWVYSGPLLGEVADVEVVESAQIGADGKVVTDEKGNAKTRNEIKQFICRVTGCTMKHSTDLSGRK